MADAPEFEEFLRRRHPMNRDELDGKGEKIKGRAKQAWGDLTNDQKTHDEGVADEAAGVTANFNSLSASQQNDVINFLSSL